MYFFVEGVIDVLILFMGFDVWVGIEGFFDICYWYIISKWWIVSLVKLLDFSVFGSGVMYWCFILIFYMHVWFFILLFEFILRIL